MTGLYGWFFLLHKIKLFIPSKYNVGLWTSIPLSPFYFVFCLSSKFLLTVGFFSLELMQSISRSTSLLLLVRNLSGAHRKLNASFGTEVPIPLMPKMLRRGHFTWAFLMWFARCSPPHMPLVSNLFSFSFFFLMVEWALEFYKPDSSA